MTVKSRRGSRGSWIAAIGAALAVALGAGPEARGDALVGGFSATATRQLPAVVGITTTREVAIGSSAMAPKPGNLRPGGFFQEFFGEPWEGEARREVNALGSGFIVSRAGHVMTNHHVIADAEEIRVVLHDDRELPASVVGSDPETELALLKIDAGEPLPQVVWGSSDSVSIGDWVIAVGNPFGLGGTVTIGVLSGRSDVPIGPGGDFMLQTDASINQGNSGGPLFNAEGEVIGVNTMILSPTGGNVGIGFAVPSSVAQSISQQLLTHGRVERGWLGIQIQRMTKPLAESLGLEESQGALITHVQEDGPADRSGLEPADVILRFADEPILRAETLPRIVAGLEAGRTAEIGIWRNRELRTVEVEIGEQKPRKIALEKDAGSREEKGPGPRDAEGSESWGIVVESIGPQVRQALGLGSDVSGVAITAVEPGGPAAGQGLRPGDLILQMAGRSVASLGDVAEQLREASEEERSRILLRVRRKDRYRFVTLPL